MKGEIKIGNKKIGKRHPVFIVAEISANHLQKFDYAIELIKVARKAGADAVKFQTYTPDTLTIDCDNKYFQIKQRSKHQLGSECSVELKHFAYFFVKGKTQGKGKKPNRHLTIECLNLFLLYKSGNSSTS